MISVDVGMSVLATVLEANGAETGSTFWQTTSECVASVIVVKRGFAPWALEIDFISKVIEYNSCSLIQILGLGPVTFTKV